MISVSSRSTSGNQRVPAAKYLAANGFVVELRVLTVRLGHAAAPPPQPHGKRHDQQQGNDVEAAFGSGGAAAPEERTDGMLVEEVHTGRVMAMQGGFDVIGSSYNRAIQAFMRWHGGRLAPRIGELLAA